MEQRGIKRNSIFGAVCVSLMVGIYAGWMAAHNLEPTDLLVNLYWFVLVLLIATWLIADTRQSGRTQPTFDYGWFILIASVVYVPYYLFSTRRWRGLLVLALMVLVFFFSIAIGALLGAMYVS
jgi:hypothetical protein